MKKVFLYIIVLLSIIYILLCMRYYIFNFQDDTTLFIEDSSVDKVRDDNKLTYYQFPPDYNIQDNKGLSVSKKINRSLVSRKIYFIGKDTEQLSVYIFYPNQTDILLDIENQSKFDKTIESVFGFIEVQISKLNAACSINIPIPSEHFLTPEEIAISMKEVRSLE